VDKYSRAKAASLSATVQSKMARTGVARVMEKVIKQIMYLHKKMRRPSDDYSFTKTIN
jgi:hypothetical protein